LTSVILNIELMDELIKDRELQEFKAFVDRTRNNVQRLKKLINELYKSAKLISGNFDPEAVLFDFEEMIDETVHSIQQIYPGYAILKKNTPTVTLFADRDKLIQVLTNYLTNAIKYGDGNPTIEIDIQLEETLVTVSVKDYGRGIPIKDLPYIFNRFYRAEKTKSFEGLGLGLFLSRQIIEAHKGRTWVESQEGDGSTFYFSLPLTHPDQH
jgi:two-component system phosphate regulon sensor histidine kinase PhoR